MPTAPRADRYDCLDTLRGVAVLGILMANVQMFAMVWVAADVPVAQMDFTSTGNRLVWWFTQTFFALNFVTIFSAMFGAGIVLMLGEGEASHQRHFRRMAWLLFFGMLHAYVFWFGDLLVPYALSGMVIVAARRMSVAGLTGLGLGLIAFTGLLWIGGMAVGGLSGDVMTLAEIMGQGPQEVVRATALYQAGFMDRLLYNFGLALQSQLLQLVMFSGRIVGVMMLGMAAYKSGFLTSKWSVKHYLQAGGAALVTGLLLNGWGALAAMQSEFAPSHAVGWVAAQYIGSLLVSFGYAAGVMIICKKAWLPPVRRALSAVGRMAFTNYLTQTVILTLIFVGTPGLGLFGQVERVTQVGIVLVIWALQLTWSQYWLARFHYGPFEWAWRSLTYGRTQPFRRTAAD